MGSRDEVEVWGLRRAIYKVAHFRISVVLSFLTFLLGLASKYLTMKLMDSINFDILQFCFNIALLGICLSWLVSNYGNFITSIVVNVKSLSLFSIIESGRLNISRNI
jgi:hypothetical protein